MSSVSSPSSQSTPSLSSFHGVGLMLVSVLCFSASLLVIKAIHLGYGLSFWVITLPRFVVGILLAQVLFRRDQSIHWKSLFTQPWMIARGLLGGIGVPFYNLCVIEIGAGRASIITATYPIFGMLFAPLFLPERASLRMFAFAALAIAGVAAMTGFEAITQGPQPYDLLAIAVAIISGLVIVIIRQLHGTSNTATIFASQCVYGLIFCMPGFLIDMGTGADLSAVALTILAAGLVAIGQLTMTHSFRSLSIAKGSSIQLLGPPMVAGSSHLLFGERFGLVEIVAAIVILASCYQIAIDRQPAR